MTIRAALATFLAGMSLLAATAASAGTVLTAGTYAPRGSNVADRHALFATDVRTGASVILSDFANPAQGPVGGEPIDVAVRRGRILVLDHDASTPGTTGMLLWVDARGRRSVLSDLGDPALGPTAVSPNRIAVARSGAIYVVDGDAGPTNDGAVLEIDARDGRRRIVSAFSDGAQGPALTRDPYGIAVRRDGTILVIDNDALYAIDPRDGRRVVLSRFADPAQGARIVPEALAVTASDQILLADPRIETRSTFDQVISGAVLRVDPATGVRTIVSRSSDPAQGAAMYGPFGLAPAPSGALYVSSLTPDEIPAIFAVDVASGKRRFTGGLASPRDGWRGGGLGVAYHPSRLVRCPRGSCRTPLPGAG